MPQRPTVPLDDRLEVIPHNGHRDRRVELDLAPDEILERVDAALLVVVALRCHVLSAPQLDEDVFDAGDRDVELVCVQDKPCVVGMFPESRKELLPLLDGDADTSPLSLDDWLAGS